MKDQVFKWIEHLFVTILIGVFVWQMFLTLKKNESDFFNFSHFVSDNFGKDFVSQYGSRYGELRTLFQGPTRIGYIGEEGESFSKGVTNYFLTQYYLTPNLVLKDKMADTILYNLYSTVHLDYASNFYLHNGWHLVKDFNNGLILLAK